MKKQNVIAIVIIGFLTVSIFLQAGMAVKPPKANLNVTMSEPVDGLSVATDGSFDVTGVIPFENSDTFSNFNIMINDL